MTSNNAFRLLSLPEDPTHPVQVSLRTYGLALFLSLAPSLTPVLTSVMVSRKLSNSHINALKRLLKRELGMGGFAFAITAAIGGGTAVRSLWSALDDTETCQDMATSRLQELLQSMALTPSQKTFLSYFLTSSLGIVLLQTGRHRSILGAPKPSRTLDLTLLLFIRALDAVVQAFVFHRSSRVRDQSAVPTINKLPPDAIRQRLMKEKHAIKQKERREVLTTRIDGLVFWACSARIMWCFVYEPTRLPRSYVRWIGALANADPRLIRVLQLIREKQWGYINGSIHYLPIIETLATDMGYPAAWGNPSALPAYGGAAANSTWKTLGVRSRLNLGGLPCEIVHGGVGSSLGLSHSCGTNITLRALKAFAQAFIIYLPVHFLPILLTRPKLLFRPHRVLRTLVGSLRSASFLASFISTFWSLICLTRTVVAARLLPGISHDFWDGPYGCILAACMACGNSIWIEHPRRRGEMAMYVLPRAIRSLLPESLVRSGYHSVLALERLVFVVSLSSLVTAMVHQPDSLRGLSRWALALVMNGPNAGFWQKRRSFDPSVPATPSIPATPYTEDTQA